jgi:hypothetical protein
MTLIAIGRFAVDSKLTFVVIGMTIGTSVMLQRCCKGCFMARFTAYQFVFSNKFEICFVMVEFIHSFYGME